MLNSNLASKRSSGVVFMWNAFEVLENAILGVFSLIF